MYILLKFDFFKKKQQTPLNWKLAHPTDEGIGSFSLQGLSFCHAEL